MITLKIVQTYSKGHICTNPRTGQYLTHAHTHTTRAVATTDNCFAHSGARQRGKVIGVMNRVNPHLKNPLAYCRSECKAVYQAPASHNTCGSCWLGTAQQFYHDMRGEGGFNLLITRDPGAHIHQPTAWPLPHA